MAGKITLGGDFRALQALADRLSKPQTALRMASRNMSDEALNLINEGFQHETDPYGKPWAPLKHRVGKILTKTGGMASSWHREVSPSGFRIWSGREYSKYHQGGTKGHEASTRFQPVAGKGFSPFIKRSTAGKRQRQAVAVRELNFVEGGGKIPARKMVPDKGLLPPKWRVRLTKAAKEALEMYIRT